jgi:putative serine protease PepD
MRIRTTIATLAAAATAGAGVAGVVAGGQSGAAVATSTVTVAGVATNAAAVASSARSVAEIYQDSVDGVVEITATVRSSSPYGPVATATAQGTGFEIDRRGDIVTNAHVISGADRITVKTHDGIRYAATVVGGDATTDVAVIRIDAPAASLDPLTLGDSAAVSVGDAVVAIGDPFGLADTVTTGIVSAVGRTITSPNGRPITGAIQTDAAINHGNSGGPLLATSGAVIGITSQISSDGSGGNVGIGFAVPSNTVRTVAARLIRSGGG